jgi:hypothetical protein
MSRIAPALLFLCISLASRPAQATIKIVPTHPTPADSVYVTVGGGFSDLRWNDIGQASCLTTQPDTLAVSVAVNFCHGLPGCSGGQFPFSYTRTCSFGRLAVGTYVVMFTELHLNSSDPLPTVTQTIQFTVSDPTPALRRTWGALKTAYR